MKTRDSVASENKWILGGLALAGEAAVSPTTWHHCYDDGWKGLITPSSFSHPAKMAHGLLERILIHGFDRGWWREGDLIGDPFGGIGTTGIMCSYRGLRSVAVELEPKFVALAQANFELHRRKWEAVHDPIPVLVQGDSGGGLSLEGFIAQQERHSVDYGSSVGQIGALKSGGVDAVLTSPPYAESLKPETEAQTQAKQRRIAKSKCLHDGRKMEVPSPGKAGLGGGYGDTAGNIGSLKSGEVDAVVTSPPYEGTNVAQKDRRTWASRLDQVQRAVDRGDEVGPEFRRMLKTGVNPASNLTIGGYGDAAGNIGNDSGETYWAAMLAVYRQCFLALKPGGIACIVVKNYVQKKQIVNLCDDTLKLLVHIGFEPVERIHAMLTKTTRTPALFEKEHVTTKERKSFFRRLAEKKGSPAIDYEEVLILRKPN